MLQGSAMAFIGWSSILILNGSLLNGPVDAGARSTASRRMRRFSAVRQALQ